MADDLLKYRDPRGRRGRFSSDYRRAGQRKAETRRTGLDISRVPGMDPRVQVWERHKPDENRVECDCDQGCSYVNSWIDDDGTL